MAPVEDAVVLEPVAVEEAKAQEQAVAQTEVAGTVRNRDEYSYARESQSNTGRESSAGRDYYLCHRAYDLRVRVSL